MNDAPIQLIFCVESPEKVPVDEIYINEILNRFYKVGENKISYVFMGGKYNYNNRKTIEKIARYKKDYQVTGTGQSYVIYVFDKDRNSQYYTDAQFEQNVIQYCASNNYLLVWFVQTIEDVMWGERVEKQKREKAIQYIKKRHIESIHKGNLSARSNVNARQRSNILTELNKFPQLKYRNGEIS